MSTSRRDSWVTGERAREHPHGLPDREFDALFTADKPIVFAFHEYPWLFSCSPQDALEKALSVMEKKLCAGSSSSTRR